MYMSDHEYEEQRNTLLVRFEGHFQSSQTPSDTSAEIISIIKSYPTPACAEALAFSTVLHAHASPQGVDGLVLAIKTIKDALEAHPIEILQDDGPQLFTFVFGYTLSDFMNDYLHETYLHQPKRTTITPTNATLSTALFSASGLKHRMFLGNSGVYGFARQGLQLPNADREPERDEVLAVGACLQLSVAGAKDWLDDGDGNTVLQALKGLKERGVVRSSDGMRLLDKTISIAEGKFSQVISPEQAWNILFST